MSSRSPHHILVIRRDNIGDLVCTTPLLHALRAALPEARISVLVNSYNRPVLDGNPDINDICTYEKLKHTHGWRGKWAAMVARIGLLLRLRQRRFDLAILAKSGFDPYALRMARLAGAKRIIGFAPPAGRGTAGLTDPVAVPDAPLHEVETVTRLAQAIGITATPGPIRLFPQADLCARFRAELARTAGVTRWLALHISAREKTRQWPADKFVALIAQLASDPQWHDLGFALFWSPGRADNLAHPGDDEKAEEIRERTRGYPVVPMMTTRLEELIAGVAACDAFVGADGGAMHVAVGAGLPVVALFENSSAKRTHWYPWQVPYRLLQPATFAVEDIDIGAVTGAVRDILHETSGAAGPR